MKELLKALIKAERALQEARRLAASSKLLTTNDDKQLLTAYMTLCDVTDSLEQRLR